MNIVLMGPPASGKGTQAKFLEKEFGLVHLSTGDMLREIASQNTELAKEVKNLIDKGSFVPDNLIIEVVRNKIDEIKSHDTGSQKGILFDGFPRTVSQAKELEKMIDIDYVIEIHVSKESIVKRVLDRGVCKKCGKSFLLSQTTSSVCDECGGEIGKRNDDRKEIAEERYVDYISKTYPIVEFYKDKQGFVRIDGEKSMSDVFKDIVKILRS